MISIAPTTGIPFGHVPAYLPGSSSLVEELDARVLVVLRDGRHLLGVSNEIGRDRAGRRAKLCRRETGALETHRVVQFAVILCRY